MNCAFLPMDSGGGNGNSATTASADSRSRLWTSDIGLGVHVPDRRRPARRGWRKRMTVTVAAVSHRAPCHLARSQVRPNPARIAAATIARYPKRAVPDALEQRHRPVQDGVAGERRTEREPHARDAEGERHPRASIGKRQPVERGRLPLSASATTPGKSAVPPKKRLLQSA